MGDSMEAYRADLRPLNDYERFRRERSRFAGFAIASAVLAGIGVWAATFSGRSFANGPGPIYFEVAVTTFAAVMLAILLVARGTELGVELRVDDSCLEFRYPSGKARRFIWTEPTLRIVFLDYVHGPSSELQGTRVTCLWMPFVDRTHVPNTLFEAISTAAPGLGVSVRRVKHPPTGGERVIFSRGT